MENLLNMFFAQSCMFCGGRSGVICLDCLAECRILYRDCCVVCEGYSPWGITHRKCLNNDTPVQVISCFEYEGLVRELIRKSKYGSKRFAALKVLGLYGYKYLYNCGLRFTDYFIVPIPVSKARLADRGFNQADILVKIFTKVFETRGSVGALTRSKATVYQHTNSRLERFKNVSSAFSTNPAYLSICKDAKFILVDDIVTSGATFLEAASVLYNAGAAEVKCVALSRRLLKGSEYSKNTL